MPDLINLDDPKLLTSATAPVRGDLIDLDDPNLLTSFAARPGQPHPDPVQPDVDPDWDQQPIQPQTEPGDFYGPRTVCTLQDMSEKVQLLDDLGAHFLDYRGRDLDSNGQVRTEELWGRMRDTLDKNGVRTSATDKTIWKAAQARLNNELGPMWADTLNHGDTGRIIGAAVLAETIAHAELNSVDGVDGYATERWTQGQVAATLKLPGALGSLAPEQFALECRDLEHLWAARKGFANSVMHVMGNAIGAERDLDPYRQSLLDKYYVAVTGQTPKGVSNRDKAVAIEPWQEQVASLRAKARKAEMYRRAGFDVSPDQLDKEGNMPLSALAPAAEPLNRYFVMQQYGVSYTNPDKMADYRTVSRLKSELADNPVQFVSRVLGGAPWDNPLAVTMRAALEGEADPEMRWRTFAEMADSLQLRATIAPGYQKLFKQYHLEERGQHDKRLDEARRVSSDMDHRDLNREITDGFIQQRNAVKKQEDVRAEAQSKSFLTQLAFIVPHAIGTVIHKSGLGKIDEALMPVNQWLLDNVFDPDPVSGVLPDGHQLVDGMLNRRHHTLGQALTDNVWFGRVDDAAYERYLTRKRAGQTDWTDELSVLGFSIWDTFSDLPGMTLDSPTSAAAMVFVGGKAAKGRHALVKKAADAGVPRPLLAAAQALLEPDRLTQAVSTLIGTDMAQMRHYGIDAYRLRKLMKRHPEQAPHMTKLIESLDRVFNNSTNQNMVGSNMRAYSAAVSALWNQAETGKVPSLLKINKAMKEGMHISPELATHMIAPPSAIKPGPVRDAAFARKLVEDDLRYISEFEQGLLRGDPQLAATLDKPVSHYMVEAHNAYNAGKFEQFMSSTTQRLATALKASPATVQKWGEFFSRHVPQLNKFEHLSDTWADATAAWKTTMTQATDLRSILGIGATHQYLRTGSINADLALAQRRASAIRALPPAEQAQHAARLAKYDSTIEQLTAERDLRQRTLNKSDLHMVELSRLMNQHIFWGAGQDGIEGGHRTTFNAQERAMLAEPLVDLVQKMGTRAERFGVPKSIIQTIMSANRELPQRLVQDFADTKSKLRKISTNHPDFDNLHAMYRRLETEIHNRLVKSATRGEHWHVPSLSDVYQHTIKGARARVQSMIKDTASQAGPSFLPLDLMRMFRYPLQKNAAAGHIAARAEASGSVLHSALNKAQEMYDELPVEVQRIHDVAWADPSLLSPGEQARLVSELMVREKQVRHAVIDAAVRVGRIDPEKAAKMKAGTYNERYYVEHQFSRELADMGYQVAPHSGKMPPTKPARFSALSAQRSPFEVRQFYTDPHTGKLRELSGKFTLKQYGTPGAALKAARQWAAAEVAEGRLLKEHIHEPQPIITDAEFLNLGVIGPTGTFRFDRVRELINDTQRYDMFRTYAQMGGLSRPALDQIPLNRRGEWSSKPLQGREWGALEGKHIHKNLYQYMNAWDSYSHVMEGVFDSMKEQLGQTKDLMMLNAVDRWLSPQVRGTEKGVLAPVKRAIRSWQHNLIIKSVETHIANHMTNLTTMPLIGVNPFRRSAVDSYYEYGRIADDIAAGDLNRMSQADAADFRYMHERGLLGATVGTTSSKLSSDMTKVGLGRVDKVMANVRKHHQAQVNRQLRRVEHIERAVSRIQAELDLNLEDRTLSAAAEAKLRDQHSKFSELLRLEQKKVPTKFMQHPVLQLGQDALKSLVDADRSVIAQHLSAHYGAIDPAYKYMAFKELRRKGASQAEAYQVVLDYMQNYNLVPPAVRALKKHSIVGAMVPSFPFEAGRIMKNLIQKAPGKALAYAAAVPAFNMATLTSHGLSINDLKQQLGTDSDHELFVDMMSNLYIPGPDSLHRVNVGKYGLLSGFLRSGGLLSPLIQGKLIPSLENGFGAGVAAVGGAAANYFSQFAANHPLGNIAAKRVMGVDPFTKELTFGSGEGFSGVVAGLLGDIVDLTVPRTAVSLYESKDKVKPPSLVTGHRKTWLEAIISGAVGVNMSKYTKSEALARMAISYSRAGQLDEVFQEMKTERRRDFEGAAASAKYALDQGDEETYNRYYEEALELLKADKQGQEKYIAGRRQDVSKTDRALEKQLMEYIGRNVYQTIERVPIDLAPSFALDAWTSGWVDKSGPEMEHIWRQLQDTDYLENQRDPELLARAINKTTELSGVVRNGELRSNLARSAQMLGVQFLKAAMAEAQADSPAELLRGLLQSKKGAQATALQRVIRAGQP